MPFQVKATVIGFLGNLKAYPCHMQHKIGDEVIFDGESYSGRLCPDVWPLIAPKVAILHQAGPRYFEWISYYPFWYCSPSVPEPARKKYDGLGFKNVLKTINPPLHDMARLAPPEAFNWPPSNQRNIAREPTVTCPDSRTSMLLKLEAFDLSQKGFDVPYFRREMAILAKLRSRKETSADKIIRAFTKDEIEEIYPPLSPVMLQMLVEELELTGYIKTRRGLISITLKGQAKLKDFKAGLPEADLAVFEQYEK
jgi:uncharacterized repeat protein (TIGR04076 family)